MKNRTHPFKLVSDTAALIFARIGGHQKVGTLNLQPVFRLVAGGSVSCGHQEGERNDPWEHAVGRGQERLLGAGIIYAPGAPE